MTGLITLTDGGDLAAEINQEHEACVRCAAEAAYHAFKAGDLLLDAQNNQVPEGEWLDWLSEHTKLSVRTAQVYMYLAKNVPVEMRSSAAHQSIRKLLKSIKGPAAIPDRTKTIDGKAEEVKAPTRTAHQEYRKTEDDYAAEIIRDAEAEIKNLKDEVDPDLLREIILRELTFAWKPDAAEPAAASKKKPASKKTAAAPADATEQECAHPGSTNKFKDKRAKFCPEHRTKTKVTKQPAGNGADPESNGGANKDLTLYLSQEAIDLINKIPRRPGRDLLFGTGSYGLHEHTNLKEALNAIILKNEGASIVYIEDGKRHEDEPWRPHWLRHTFTTHQTSWVSIRVLSNQSQATFRKNWQSNYGAKKERPG
jgi:hypothetical protein